MNNPRRLALIAICALVLPAIFMAATNHDSGVTLREDLVLMLGNWLLIELPQLIVIVLATVFPRLRRQFAPRALLLLSVLLASFIFLTSLEANGPMFWVFYFPLSAVLMLVVGLTSTGKANAREL
jgi:hypothetical protein